MDGNTNKKKMTQPSEYPRRNTEVLMDRPVQHDSHTVYAGPLTSTKKRLRRTRAKIGRGPSVRCDWLLAGDRWAGELDGSRKLDVLSGFDDHRFTKGD